MAELEAAPPLVVAVIPIHNGRDRTLRCLASIAASTVVPTVVVVDDGSTDGSAAAIAEAFPEVVVLPGDGNLWWSGAMNEGIRWALDHDADHVLSLNNDCIVEPRAIEALVEAAADLAPAIVGSKIRFWHDPDRIMCAGGALRSWREGLLYRGVHELDEGQWDERGEVDWLPGMSVLIPTAVFRTVGLYDATNFPMSWGDNDLVWRARDAGWRIGYEGTSVVWNDTEQTEMQVPERPTPGDLWRLLTDIKSRYRMRPAVRYFVRHLPARQLPRALYTFYHPLYRALRRAYLPTGRWAVPADSP